MPRGKLTPPETKILSAKKSLKAGLKRGDPPHHIARQELHLMNLLIEHGRPLSEHPSHLTIDQMRLRLDVYEQRNIVKLARELRQANLDTEKRRLKSLEQEAQAAGLDLLADAESRLKPIRKKKKKK